MLSVGLMNQNSIEMCHSTWILPAHFNASWQINDPWDLAKDCNI